MSLARAKQRVFGTGVTCNVMSNILADDREMKKALLFTA